MGFMKGAVTGLLLVASAAPGQDTAGTATGYLVTDRGTRVELRHARARLIDDAADGNPEDRQIRVLLSDRPVAAEIFEGRSETTTETLARQGDVQGLLLTFDPTRRTGFSYTELEPPEDERQSLLFGSISNSEGVWDGLEASGQRVTGTFSSVDEERPRLQAAFSFDAPITEDPIERILTGEEASRSELVPIAISHLESALAEQSPEQQAVYRPMVTNLMPLIRRPLRIVLRERTAELVAGEEDSSFHVRFVREGDRWRALPAG